MSIYSFFIYSSVLKEYGSYVAKAKALYGASRMSNQLLSLEAQEPRVDEKVMASTPRP